jgi:predicted Fe-Mo cluster-binding NifX family protein
MRIAIAASQSTKKGIVESRFGRAAWFMVYDGNLKSWDSIENKVNLESSQGAGIQTAELLVKNGVDVVIAGHCGPKAFHVLQEAGIRLFANVTGNIEDALEAFLENRLAVTESANATPHW